MPPAEPRTGVAARSAGPAIAFARRLLRLGPVALLACASLLALATPVRAATPAAAPEPAPNIALYYGANPPWDELAAFDLVVVEPGHVKLPVVRPDVPAKGPGWLGTRTELLAYVSVGEVHPSRPYFKALPEAWRAGANTAWGSIVIDQARPEWPAWFVEHAVAPLWREGYRGFFLDTLDSFHLIAKTDAERERQQAGLIRVVRAIKAAYPEAKLVFNRGFEILPQVHELATAVAAESLFRGWDAGRNAYREVNEADRDWLIGQLATVRDRYRLPVLAIDYVPPEQRELARDTARRIAALGFMPWVSNPALDLLGVGAIEVMPRKVLFLYEGLAHDLGLTYEPALRYATMPLNYLGYTVNHREIRQPLPEYPLAGRYAGIVTLFSSDVVDARVGAFLKAAIAQGVRVAALGTLGVPRGAPMQEVYGLSGRAPRRPPARVNVEAQDALIGFETPPLPDRRGFFALEARGGRSLLRLRSDGGETMDAAALMPWGGYALRPYSTQSLPAGKGERWVVQPIGFLRAALALPDMPVPDVTTENGRRLMLVHVDGDGFASRAELPGSPYAGEAMLRELLEKYPVPSTVSVIQGELAPEGLYPKDSPALEAIARRIFALPHVEIASHSFSHPFRWSKVETDTGNAAETYSLNLPGYRFSIEAEVDGSLKYINSRLAPPGKQARVFLWTGDCNPGEDSVEQTYEASVANMNGGDTWITRAEPSLTLVSPVGIRKGDHFQVYAPNQNENVYTNLWTGPYYGYERAIETFELTDRPWRLKPINIYYHTYSATKRASLSALDRVYQWALAQPVLNIHASEYVRKALDFMRITVARSLDGSWVTRGGGSLRTFRTGTALHPELTADGRVAGYNTHGDQHYIHVHGAEARITLGSAAPTGPYLLDANAPLQQLAVAPGRLTLEFEARMPLEFTLANAQACRVAAGNATLNPAPGQPGRFQTRINGRTTITVRCGA